MIVLFALVAHGEYRDGTRIVDFEQGDKTRASDRNDQLAQKRVSRPPDGFSAGKRKHLQHFYRLCDGRCGALGSRKIVFEQEIVQAKRGPGTASLARSA